MGSSPFRLTSFSYPASAWSTREVLDQSGVAGGDLPRIIGASHRGEGPSTSQSVVQDAGILRPDPDHHGRDRDAEGHVAHRLLDTFEGQDRADARNRVARPEDEDVGSLYGLDGGLGSRPAQPAEPPSARASPLP